MLAAMAMAMFMFCLTPRVTCGPRRARALRASVGGERARSRERKARDRPDRQVHAVVRRLIHFLSSQDV